MHLPSKSLVSSALVMAASFAHSKNVYCTPGWNGTLTYPPSSVLNSTTLRKLPASDANQGVAVASGFLYSIDNYSITKRDLKSGKPLLQWYGGEDGAIIHFDGGFVHNGLIILPHSNYPASPITSSIEMYNATSLEHIKSHSFGIYRGSLTWVDYYNGAWWGTFANYDRVQKGQSQPYGLTMNTQLVKFDDSFNVVQSWIYPEELYQSFSPMSNSGGSFGPDGFLYITGHDASEVYVIQVPAAGSIAIWVATVAAPDIAGQGIAWDRSGDNGKPLLYGIARDSLEIVEMDVPLQACGPQEPSVGAVFKAGNFQSEEEGDFL